MVDEGTCRAYTNRTTPAARLPCWPDPAGSRKNTKDNAPAVVHIDMIPGDKRWRLKHRGQGWRLREQVQDGDALNPSDDIVEWVLKTC